MLRSLPTDSPVGLLCRDLPRHVTRPPIETVVFAWGVNEDRQLGLDDKQNVPTPKVVEAFLGIRLAGRSFYRSPIVTGSRNTLAIDNDGQVWSWGWNDRGTLGLGHQMAVSKPQRLAALNGVRISQVAVNGWHCLALSEQGQVFAWGGNEYLQCGVDPQKRDVLVPTPCLPQLKIRQVACGGMHSLALTEDGNVWTWGEPWGDFSMNVERRPRPVPGAVGMACIAAGAFHNMALSHAGEVYTWGTNDYGQLGNGHTTYDTQPSPVVDMDGILISDIAAGGWHSLALTCDGEVYAWGRGEYGRLGIGEPSGSSKLRPCKVRALEGHRIVQVTAGGTHTLAVSAEGRMWSWGRASFGRLGLGNISVRDDMYSPVEVALPGGFERWAVCAVACGGRHSMCLALPVHHDRGPNGGSVTSDSGLVSEEVDGGSEASLFCRDHQGEGEHVSGGASTGMPPARVSRSGNNYAPLGAYQVPGRVHETEMAAALARANSLASANSVAVSQHVANPPVGPPTPPVAPYPANSSFTQPAEEPTADLQLPMPPATTRDDFSAAAAALLPPTASWMSTGISSRHSSVSQPASTRGELPSAASGDAPGLETSEKSAVETAQFQLARIRSTGLNSQRVSISATSAPSTPLSAAPSAELLDALPSIELHVGLRNQLERLTVDVMGPASHAAASLGTVTPLSGGSPDHALAPISTTASPRPQSAGSRSNARRHASNVGSPTALRSSPTRRGQGSVYGGGDGDGSEAGDWEGMDNDERLAEAEGSVAVSLWPDPRSADMDMHTLVDMSLEDEDVGEQRKVAAKAKRRAARRQLHTSVQDAAMMMTRKDSVDSGQQVATGSYQARPVLLEGDSSSPASQDEEDEDDHADDVIHVSGLSRISFHPSASLHDEVAASQRSTTRPMSPSHAYLARGMSGIMGGPLPPGSPVSAQMQANMTAGMMSPLRMSGSPHEQAALDVAARLAAAVVGSPRNSALSGTLSFQDMLGVPRSASPLPAGAVSPLSGNTAFSPSAWRTASGGGLQPGLSGAPASVVASRTPSSASADAAGATAAGRAGSLTARTQRDGAQGGGGGSKTASSPRAGGRRRGGGGLPAVGGEPSSQPGTPLRAGTPDITPHESFVAPVVVLPEAMGSAGLAEASGQPVDDDDVHDALLATLGKPLAA